VTRIAIFVEGQTERKFAKKLIWQRYGHLTPKVNEIICHGKGRFISIQEPQAYPGVDWFVLLIEVPSRDTLVSYIKDNATNMIFKRGFNLLLGLLDLFPDKRSDKIQRINAINTTLKESPACDKVRVILAVMETEAWFLCDWHMFQRIDTRLTTAFIQSHLGLDLVTDDPELAYKHPSKTLDEILEQVQRRYRKRSSEIDTVVGKLDLGFLCSCTSKIDSFFRFISELDSRIPKSHTTQK